MYGERKKRKVKTPLQKMHDKCWTMAKQVVALRDNHQCQHCFKRAEGTNGHTSHVLPKSVGNGVRYDLLNLKLLCYHCHINWWHKNPAESGSGSERLSRIDGNTWKELNGVDHTVWMTYKKY